MSYYETPRPSRRTVTAQTVFRCNGDVFVQPFPATRRPASACGVSAAPGIHGRSYGKLTKSTYQASYARRPQSAAHRQSEHVYADPMAMAAHAGPPAATEAATPRPAGSLRRKYTALGLGVYGSGTNDPLNCIGNKSRYASTTQRAYARPGEYPTNFSNPGIAAARTRWLHRRMLD